MKDNHRSEDPMRHLMLRFAGVLLVAVVSVCSYGAAAAAESASGGVSLTLSAAAAPAATWPDQP